MRLKKICSTTYKIIDWDGKWVATINYPGGKNHTWSLICDNLILGDYAIKEDALIAVKQYLNGTFDGDIKGYDYVKKVWATLSVKEIEIYVAHWKKQEAFYKTNAGVGQ